jgi:hypothetical protein
MHPILWSAWHLLCRSIGDTPAVISENWVSVCATVAAVVLGFFLVARRHEKYRNSITWQEKLAAMLSLWKQNWRQGIRDAFTVALIVWIGLFAISLSKVVYLDHSQLVGKIWSLEQDNGKLKGQLLQSQGQAKATPPQKVIKIMAAVDRFGPIDRYMDAEQKDHLYQDLKQLASTQTDRNYITVTLATVHRGDRESNKLMYQLQGVFQDAGWNVVNQNVRNYESPTYGGQIPIGIWVASTTKMDLAVESSLLNIGLHADAVPIGRVTDGSFSGTLVLIGYKDAF